MMQFLGCTDKSVPFWCMSLAEVWEWLIHVPILGFVVFVFLFLFLIGMWWFLLRIAERYTH